MQEVEKPKRGPKPLPESMKKTEKLEASVTKSDYKAIHATAKRLGIRVPDLVRDAVMARVEDVKRKQEAKNE